MNWLLEPYNTVFTVAFVVMICFAVMELLSMVLGLGFSEWLQHFGPDGGGSPVDLGADLDSDGGHLQHFLSWLEIGRLPLLISLNLFFAAFSLTGFVMQGLSISALGYPLPIWLAVGLAFTAALPQLRWGNQLFGRIWPRDESSAVHERTFVGCYGVVALGTATTDRAAEVKFIGPGGDTHYTMAFASREDLPQGTPVVLVHMHAQKPSHFLVIRNPDPMAEAFKTT